MVCFSVPADFEMGTLEKIYYLNQSYDKSCVKEVYGQMTLGDIQSSGRLTDVLPRVDIQGLENYVKKAAKYGINFNYTFNPSCYGNKEFSLHGIKQVNKLLNTIWEIGIKNLTIASPALIEIANSTGRKFEIKASTICEINSPAKAEFYKNLGVERLVVDADITRDFVKLRNIFKKFGDGVEVIVNNVCRKNCAYKMFHYNHEAHCTSESTQTVNDYYANRCIMENVNNVEAYIKMCWIRPEDLHFYESCGIKNFKIQGRQNINKSNLIKTIESYFERNFDGNLYDLINLFSANDIGQQYIDNKKLDGFIDKFYEEPDFCMDLCGECGYCLGYAKRCIDNRKAERIQSMAKRIIVKRDKFAQLLEDKSML